MALTMNKTDGEAKASALSSPLMLLATTLVLAGILLSLPLILPVGPMYWDVFIYYDAANRIGTSQVPILDFFTPVGPLGYYLFAGLVWLFPDGQPMLLAHWSLLLITAPLMGALVWHVDRSSRSTAFALLIPFLFFALLPFNTREFYPFPGSDGFGIYNRQVCQLLYVLVAACLFVRQGRLLELIVVITMTALFFLKITGFVAGGVICAYAFAAGRVSFRSALIISVTFAAILAAVEFSTGLVSHYVIDILRLLLINGGTLLPRFLQSASLNFGVVLMSAALILALLWFGRRSWADSARAIRTAPGAKSLTVFFDQTFLWLGVVLFAGILFETQNTGSQAFIFLWPVLLAILYEARKYIVRPVRLLIIAALVAAVALPPAVKVSERAARAYVGAAKNTPLDNRNLGSLGAINMRSEVATRTEHMLKFYPEHRALYDDMIAVGELPTPVLYSDFDFQTIYLTSVDRAVDSIRSLEAAKGVRFETIMSLNFVNPFPWLMDRSAPLHIAIGADPFRAVPAPGSEEEAAVADTDLVLYPTCPPTTANAELYKMYAPALTGHTRIKLDACYDAFVHPKFAAGLAK
jgi:hypothetical protein